MDWGIVRGCTRSAEEGDEDEGLNVVDYILLTDMHEQPRSFSSDSNSSQYN